MFDAWAPDYSIGRIEDFDFTQLSRRGVRHLVFDIDNTLVASARPEAMELGEAIRAFLPPLVTTGSFASLSLGTNTTRDVRAMAASVGAQLYACEGRVRKPLPAFYRRIIRALGCAPAEIAMFDDKLTHVVGARAAGMVGIKVQPLGPEKTLDRLVLRRPIENLVAAHWRRRP